MEGTKKKIEANIFSDLTTDLFKIPDEINSNRIALIFKDHLNTLGIFTHIKMNGESIIEFQDSKFKYYIKVTRKDDITYGIVGAKNSTLKPSFFNGTFDKRDDADYFTIFLGRIQKGDWDWVLKAERTILKLESR